MTNPLKPIKLALVPLHGGVTIGAKLRLCQRTLDRLWEYYSELMRVGAPGMEGFTQEDFDALATAKIAECLDDILQQIKKQQRSRHDYKN